jgi:hypothetical protein
MQNFKWMGIKILEFVETLIQGLPHSHVNVHSLVSFTHVDCKRFIEGCFNSLTFIYHL